MGIRDVQGWVSSHSIYNWLLLSLDVFEWNSLATWRDISLAEAICHVPSLHCSRPRHAWHHVPRLGHHSTNRVLGTHLQLCMARSLPLLHLGLFEIQEMVTLKLHYYYLHPSTTNWTDLKAFFSPYDTCGKCAWLILVCLSVRTYSEKKLSSKKVSTFFMVTLLETCELL